MDKLLRTSPDEAPFRFVDVAVPVVSTDGIAGVLGAHMSWAWAEDVKRTVLSGRQADDAELWVIGPDGTMLIGPRDRTLTQDPAQEDVQTFTEAASGGDMRTSIVATKGYQTYPGLGWRVAARKPAQVICQGATIIKLSVVAR
ncbi:hypothetical protein [Agrobacterium vitis]|uniref:hypothetical protein n=1 Tax=Agrobacterium vitis TaxID=373 RepID=UPI0012E8A60F|nr:hypothetical protein [Agrobacterium vitis]MVA38140.1 hypothetical protein [Agrobacterium vitis]